MLDAFMEMLGELGSFFGGFFGAAPPRPPTRPSATVDEILHRRLPPDAAHPHGWTSTLAEDRKPDPEETKIVATIYAIYATELDRFRALEGDQRYQPCQYVLFFDSVGISATVSLQYVTVRLAAVLVNNAIQVMDQTIRGVERVTYEGPYQRSSKLKVADLPAAYREAFMAKLCELMDATPAGKERKLLGEMIDKFAEMVRRIRRQRPKAELEAPPPVATMTTAGQEEGRPARPILAEVSEDLQREDHANVPPTNPGDAPPSGGV